MDLSVKNLEVETLDSCKVKRNIAIIFLIIMAPFLLKLIAPVLFNNVKLGKQDIMNGLIIQFCVYLMLFLQFTHTHFLYPRCMMLSCVESSQTTPLSLTL